MDEVAPGLFVGTTADAADASLLSGRGVAAVVSLVHDGPEKGYPPAVSVDRVPLTDGPRIDSERFERAVDRVVSRLATDESLLVHCSAGASRSPAVAATALALSGESGLDSAFERVRERRPAVDPHEALVRQAAHVYVSRRERCHDR